MKFFSATIIISQKIIHVGVIVKVIFFNYSDKTSGLCEDDSCYFSGHSLAGIIWSGAL